uniref:Cytochrome P450 monooxygenase claW n=1 Tax=Ampulloclitocybe clavipes TaxID=56467 RepID=CLAW_AMPCV
MAIMPYIRQGTVINALVILFSFWAFLSLIRVIRRRSSTTPLKGPPSESFIFGLRQIIHKSEDSDALYEQWADKYGSVYQVSEPMGSKRVVLCDPKAILHLYSKDTFDFVQTEINRLFLGKYFGRGILWAEGESHRRQRKALTPAFSNVAIRNITPVFFDSAYKTKAAWDATFESNPTKERIIIEVQTWMNHISLDSIGIAGFSHDFGSIQGKPSAVLDVFDSFSNVQPDATTTLMFTLAATFPIMLNIPNNRNALFTKLHQTILEISDELLESTRKEEEGKAGGGRGDAKSIIGSLIKAESANSHLRISQEEVIAQMNVLLLAGYETTSVSLTWALIELSRHPDVQQKLRDELSRFAATDPTWEELTNGLPYLDAVVHEILRLHAPLDETIRVAANDDVIPLGTPLQTASGNIVDRISIGKGTTVSIPTRCMNRLTGLWGDNAKEFVPDRWLNDEKDLLKANEIQGYRHLLTFIDGPRTCLGKGFAIAEFKAVLSVLIRHYTFEFPDGPETKVVGHRSIMERPKVAGQDGAKVPLLVRRVE